MSATASTTTPNGAPAVDRRAFSKRQKIALESGGFLVAEMVGAATGLGVVAVADMIIPKPILKGAAKCLSKCLIEPFLDTIEGSLTKICKLEECQVDPSKPRAERAEQIAKTVIVFGAAYVASMEAKLLTRHGINEHYGIHSGHKSIPPKASATAWEKVKHYGTLKHWSTEDKIIFAADEGIHMGALYVLNNSLAPFTDSMIKKTTGVIQKTTGWPESKAHEVASMAWIWEAANGLGAIAGIGIIAGNHSFNLSNKIAKLLVPDSHVDRLAHRSALGTSVPTHTH